MGVLRTDLVTAMPLRFLHLPFGVRIGLVISSCIICIGIYGFAFPATFLGCVLLVPIILASWLFRWRGGFFCLAGIALVLVGSYLLKFGSAFWTSMWCFSLLSGTFVGLVLVLIVGSLRRLAETSIAAQHHIEQVQQMYQHEHLANQVREQAIQNLSHELRTPLTQVQGYLELLKECREQCDTALQAYFIEQAWDGCEELLSLINTVLDTASLSSGDHHPQLQNFPLLHEVQAVAAHFDPRLLLSHDLLLDIPEKLMVHADPRFVRQVIRNLLTNAFKYTPEQTRITVRAYPYTTASEPQGSAQRICIQVQDQGPGIPPEHRQFIFQRFTRLEGTHTHEQSGTGLGLAICKQMVEAMGGRIWVASTGQEGEGSCFSFTLIGSSPCKGERARLDGDAHMKKDESGNLSGRRTTGHLLSPEEGYHVLAQMPSKLSI